MRLSTLPDWLAFIHSLHLKPIQPGLERVEGILQKLGIQGFQCPLVTVAGTNGKGSTVRGLEAIYYAAGYQVATFTSPPLFSYNEQIRINETPLDDLIICNAFAAISKIDGYEMLTPFEFQTVAALYIFSQSALDVIILEVGLGGRLDAVNAVDNDIAVITSISLDHTEWLGDTRDDIGFEKAGIFKNDKLAVIGEIDIPQRVLEVAKSKNVTLYRQGVEFHYTQHVKTFDWQSGDNILRNLPLPSLLLENMSTVLMVIQLLQKTLPVNETTTRSVLSTVSLAGRIQPLTIEGMNCVADVSHNPASIAMLANYLHQHPIRGKTIAIFSMFDDKDIKESIRCIEQEIDEWYVAMIADKRAASISKMKQVLLEYSTIVHYADSILFAFEKAKHTIGINDRLVIFGSFHTVKEALSLCGR